MKTIIFGLGGTLTSSKEALDVEMIALINKLLDTHVVAIISGFSWKQVNKQINELLTVRGLNNLYILPDSGGSMYQSWGKYGWVATYQNKIPIKEIDRISSTITDAIAESGFEQPQKIWGKQIEAGEAKVTFSALGQKAPLEAKDKWDVDGSRRKALVDVLRQKLPTYDIRIAGKNSIDIYMRGINKKFGIDELMKKLRVSRDDIMYIGDAIFKGGSDYAAIEIGLSYVQVRDLEDTKAWIRKVLDGSEPLQQAGSI